MQQESRTGNLLTLFKVALSCVLMGGLFGTITTMINCWVSPYYIQKVMHWDIRHFDLVTWAVVTGVTKGLFYGSIFSIVFTIGFGIITKGRATFGFGLRQLLRTTSFAGLCWIIGGLFAVLLTSINPNFYRNLFPIAPKEGMEMIKFAWVGGSTWGGLIGGLLSAILGVVMLRNRWYEIIHPDE